MRTAKKLFALAAVGTALLAVLTGCGAGENKAVAPVAQAASGFVESAKVDGVEITLAVEPVHVGENRFLVNLSDPEATEAEVQVIMASMGHGNFVELTKVGPGRFEATSDVLNMDGKWLLRVKATLANGEEKVHMFYLDVKQ